MRARLGPAKAVTATAHKLAKLIYNMLKHGQAYVEYGQDYYEKEHINRVVKNLTRRAKELGFDLQELIAPQGGNVLLNNELSIC